MVLRTLHLTNAWHASSGGIGTFYRALLEAANRTGWQARLVVPSAESRFEPVGRFAGIYHVRAPRAPFSPEYRVLYPNQYLLDRSPIREILRKEQPHVVEFADKYTLPYLAGLLRIGTIDGLNQLPAVVGLSCERMDETLSAYTPFGTASRMFSRVYMKCLYFPQFDHHVAVSRHAANELETASRGHKVSRGVWIRPMGVDTQRFRPERRSHAAQQALQARVGASPETALLFYAGRLAPEKNLRLLLDTVYLLRHTGAYKLLIAGSGPEQDKFFAEANQRMPGSVVHLGHESDRDRLASLYANVDAFLHPNPREPFGIAPLEAMACATPLVAPSSGGVTTYANSENAWLVEPSAEAFAGAVREIMKDPAERRRRTLGARATALRYGWPAACENFHALYWNLWQRTSGLMGPEASPGNLEPAFYSTHGNWLGFEVLTEASGR
jgi:alpha-1,6-mannosyltransferase